MIVKLLEVYTSQDDKIDGMYLHGVIARDWHHQLRGNLPVLARRDSVLLLDLGTKYAYLLNECFEVVTVCIYEDGLYRPYVQIM